MSNIFMYKYTNSSAQAGCNTSSIFYVDFNRFEISFLSPRPVAIQRLKSLTHIWNKNSLIHTFRKNISTMWNVNKLIQDLNFELSCYFLWSYSLNHKCLFQCKVLYSACMFWHWKKKRKRYERKEEEGCNSFSSKSGWILCALSCSG